MIDNVEFFIKNNLVLKLFLDLLPFAVLFISYRYQGLYTGAMCMLCAKLISMTISYYIDRRLSRFLVLTTILLIIFVIITAVTGNTKFFKMKPTFLYVILSILLYFSRQIFGIIIIKDVLHTVIDMPNQYWHQLSVRYTIFFIIMAILNEYVWRNYEETTWLYFKLFGFTLMLILFTMMQLPFIKKYGQIKEK